MPEDRPANSDWHWSGQCCATHAQLAAEESIAAPYAFVIDAADEGTVESGLQPAWAVHRFTGG